MAKWPFHTTNTSRTSPKLTAPDEKGFSLHAELFAMFPDYHVISALSKLMALVLNFMRYCQNRSKIDVEMKGSSIRTRRRDQIHPRGHQSYHFCHGIGHNYPWTDRNRVHYVIDKTYALLECQTVTTGRKINTQ